VIRRDEVNLDDFSSFNKIDTLNMLGHIDTLPDQLDTPGGWENDLPLPEWKGIDRVVVTGMAFGNRCGFDNRLYKIHSKGTNHFEP